MDELWDDMRGSAGCCFPVVAADKSSVGGGGNGLSSWLPGVVDALGVDGKTPER